MRPRSKSGRQPQQPNHIAPTALSQHSMTKHPVLWLPARSAKCHAEHIPCSMAGSLPGTMPRQRSGQQAKDTKRETVRVRQCRQYRRTLRLMYSMALQHHSIHHSRTVALSDQERFPSTLLLPGSLRSAQRLLHTLTKAEGKLDAATRHTAARRSAPQQPLRHATSQKHIKRVQQSDRVKAHSTGCSAEHMPLTSSANAVSTIPQQYKYRRRARCCAEQSNQQHNIAALRYCD